MNDRHALFLCELSGETARPWAEAGYTCWCVDIAHSIRRDRVEGNLRFVWGDVRSWCPPEGVRFAFGCAMTPCTHLTVAGARDWQKKGHYMLVDALECFSAAQMALSYAGCRYYLENPVGALSKHMREPDHKFHPSDYAGYANDPASEAYTKQTCLWTGGGFVMPEKRPVAAALGSKMHLMPPSADRASLRSATPSGFAKATFIFNAPHLQQVAA